MAPTIQEIDRELPSTIDTHETAVSACPTTAESARFATEDTTNTIDIEPVAWTVSRDSPYGMFGNVVMPSPYTYVPTYDTEGEILRDTQAAAADKARIKKLEALLAKSESSNTRKTKQIEHMQRSQQHKDKLLRQIVWELLPVMEAEASPVMAKMVMFLQSGEMSLVLGDFGLIQSEGDKYEYAIGFLENACSSTSLEDLEGVKQDLKEYYFSLGDGIEFIQVLMEKYIDDMEAVILQHDEWYSHPLFTEIQQKRGGLVDVIGYEILRLLSQSAYSR